MLNEHQLNVIIECAADRDEESARNFGEEGLEFYHSLVKEMEENKKKGLKCTYSVPNSYD